jgi:hypothetical protein
MLAVSWVPMVVTTVVTTTTAIIVGEIVRAMIQRAMRKKSDANPKAEESAERIGIQSNGSFRLPQPQDFYAAQSEVPFVGFAHPAPPEAKPQQQPQARSYAPREPQRSGRHLHDVSSESGYYDHRVAQLERELDTLRREVQTGGLRGRQGA